MNLILFREGGKNGLKIGFGSKIVSFRFAGWLG